MLNFIVSIQKRSAPHLVLTGPQRVTLRKMRWKSSDLNGAPHGVIIQSPAGSLHLISRIIHLNSCLMPREHEQHSHSPHKKSIHTPLDVSKSVCC